MQAIAIKAIKSIKQYQVYRYNAIQKTAEFFDGILPRAAKYM
jgi:hypothetical protein